MHRRHFVRTGLAAGALGAAGLGARPEESSLYELRVYELRNDLEPARIQEFFERHFLPALKRLDVGPVGAFTPEAGLPRPSLVVLIPYRSAAEALSVADRTRSDEEYMNAWRAFEAGGALPYVRYDSSLYRAFSGHPRVEVPPSDPGRAPRLFEMRSYESRNQFSLGDKIDMFNREEIAIFRKVGMAPVFFAEAVAGTRLPHLTYMVGFDSMEARMQAWDRFRGDPDWNRIKGTPGWTDPEAVSAARTVFLRPARFSEIR